MGTRKCSKCGEHKPLNEWSKSTNKEGKVRFSSYCKPCRVAYNREKYYAGRTSKKAVKTDTHRECMECNKMFLFAECFGSYCRSCFKIRFKLAPEKIRQTTKKYREAHPERWRAMHRIHQFNRRSLIKATEDGSVTDSVLKGLLDTENCYWCKKPIAASLRTIEHIKELSQGGEHTAKNLTMACLSCNSKRLGKI